ncbi:sporulation-control protein [Deinobacterium chartae]|uniref:Sporulation-control protein n=1 Tax=Deinobacterium chartae TaxID=521158 RepID=A0A841HXZ7_9DEIO|nr:sporulation protein [Deinobacterium chartae]MBB6097524.1 sporulation-control protein [Deinobacterium chartae]
MSFFKRVMASVGIGSARVDTRLERSELRIGENFRGVVHLEGGSVAQDIEGITLSLCTRYKHDDNYHTTVLDTLRTNERFTLRPGEVREIPFQWLLPFETPLSMGNARVWIQTGASVAAAVDPGDQDHLRVLPNAPVEALFSALQGAGFRFKNSEVEHAPRMSRRGGVVQEFEFYPSPEFARDVQEVELVLFPGHDFVDVLLEVDRRARGFAAFFTEEIEHRSMWRVTPDIARNPQAIAEQLRQRIRGSRY